MPSDDAMSSMDWMSRGPASVRILSFLPHRGQRSCGGADQRSQRSLLLLHGTRRMPGLNTTQDGIWGGTTLKETPRHAGNSGSRGRADVSAGQL